MVGLVLVSHSQAIAVALKELVLAMAGPKLPIAVAAGAGQNHRDLGTNGVEIMEAIKSVFGEDGVVVLMDIGSALLSTDTALGFLETDERARVRCVAAPFVEGAVAAGVVASLGSSLENVCREAERALRQKQEHLGDQETPSSSSAAASTTVSSPEKVIRLKVPNPHGLHARPAARFIREATAFSSEIQVRNLTKSRGPVSAKSLTGLASLGVLRGQEIEISARGSDASAALTALRRSVEGGLGESLEKEPASDEPPPPTVEKGPVPISGGLAIGPLVFVTESEQELPRGKGDNPDNEIARLRKAIATAKSKIDREQVALRTSLGKDEAAIFAAQELLLEDPELIEQAESAIRKNGENAPRAWAAAYQAVAASYERLEDEYQRQRAADVRDIGARVLRALGVVRSRLDNLSQPGILVVDDLVPAEVAALPADVLGVICLQGGKTSHAAILLRAKGVPAIAHAHSFLQPVHLSGRVAAFDGDTGEIWIDPPAGRVAVLRERMEEQRREAAQAALHRREPVVTPDGRSVAIFANLGQADEAEAALERGAEGVGLFRTEFLFIDRESAPSEDEQFTALTELREVLGNRPVVIRTLDVGGDKQAPYLGLPHEANPFLGERGLRVSLNRPELFQSQLRAILRAALGGNFRVMFPMVTERYELLAARSALEDAHRSLERAGVPHAWPLPVGIMVEVPAAAMLVDQFASDADFFSIGTNDLAQYVLAADRGNPALNRFQDALHPAVLRIISHIVGEAHRHSKHVAVCGEAASDLAAARILVGLGIDELSLSAARIPEIKSILRETSSRELEAFAAQAQKLTSTEEVRSLVARAASGDNRPAP